MALNCCKQVMEEDRRVIDHDTKVFAVVVEWVLINEDQPSGKSQVKDHHVVELEQYRHLKNIQFRSMRTFMILSAKHTVE